jgi:hypothetical protein
MPLQQMLDNQSVAAVFSIENHRRAQAEKGSCSSIIYERSLLSLICEGPSGVDRLCDIV